jgi:hypothetical protein
MFEIGTYRNLSEAIGAYRRQNHFSAAALQTSASIRTIPHHFALVRSIPH